MFTCCSNGRITTRGNFIIFTFLKPKRIIKIVIYRLKNEYQSTIPHAIEKAKTMLGKPYNWLYLLNDDELYCSDFVERAFRDDNKVFELIPMNFKNKETGYY